MSRCRKYNVAGPILFLMCHLLMGCVNDDHDASKGIKVGEALPTFLVDECISDSADWRYAQGEEVNMSSKSFAGKVGIIVFFNTDCEDCRLELPEIQNVYDTIKSNSNYQLVCISREETETEIKKYWKENKLTLPYSAQSDRTIYNLFAKTIIPRIYIIKYGMIAYIHTDSSIISSSQLLEEIK